MDGGNLPLNYRLNRTRRQCIHSPGVVATKNIEALYTCFSTRSTLLCIKQTSNDLPTTWSVDAVKTVKPVGPCRAARTFIVHTAVLFLYKMLVTSAAVAMKESKKAREGKKPFSQDFCFTFNLQSDVQNENYYFTFSVFTISPTENSARM